jgi:hypothetical protein
LDNDDWRAFVENAGNFNNLKNLYLCKLSGNIFLERNQVSEIKEGDAEHFKLL